MGQRCGLLPASRESHSECLSGGDILPLTSEAPHHHQHELVVVVVVAGAARASSACHQIWESRGLSLGGVAGHGGGVGAVTNDVESRPSLLLNTAGETETFLVSRKRMTGMRGEVLLCGVAQTEAWPGAVSWSDELSGVGTDAAAQQHDLPTGQTPAGMVISGLAQVVRLLQPASSLRQVLGTVEVSLLCQGAHSSTGEKSVESVIPCSLR